MTTTAKTPRAVVYCRISRDAEQEGLRVARQVEDCRKLAEREDFTVTQVYVDNDISASTESQKPRPSYDRLLADARAGHVDVILDVHVPDELVEVHVVGMRSLDMLVERELLPFEGTKPTQVAVYELDLVVTGGGHADLVGWGPASQARCASTHQAVSSTSPTLGPESSASRSA